MSSTASVSSIYGNDCKWLHLFMETCIYMNSILWINTSRTKASFLPWERSSSDTSSELSEWERKSLDRCLGSGIGEPTYSSASSYKKKKFSSEQIGCQSEAQSPTTTSHTRHLIQTVNDTHTHSSNQTRAPLHTQGWC